MQSLPGPKVVEHPSPASGRQHMLPGGEHRRLPALKAVLGMQLEREEHRHREGRERQGDTHGHVWHIPSVSLRAERRALPAALFLIAALVSGFTLLRQVDPFDEGLVLQAAHRVAEGQLPYRDFLWVYGPGQALLIGVAFAAFGLSLLWWRILRTAADAGVAVLVYVLVRREASRGWAIVAFAAAALTMAQPTGNNPFPVALLLLLGALAAATSPRGPAVVVAGLLTGLAAAWRIDMAPWGAAGVATALLLEPAAAGRRGRLVARFAASAFGVAALAYLPFLIAAGPGELFDQLVSLGARRGGELPFPFFYSGPLRTGSVHDFAHDAKDMLDYEVPLAAVAGFALAALTALLRWRRERALPPVWAGLLLLGAGSLTYLISRADEFHAQGLAAVLCALLPLCAAWGVRARALRPLGWALGAVLAVLLAAGVANRASALLFPPRLEALDLPVADGVEVSPPQARALERTVRLLQSRVPEGQPTYVATLRSDLVRINNPLMYVLAERDNVYRKDIGDITTARSQREIVAAIEGKRPRALVRWANPTTVKREPNAGGRSTSVRLLDRYLTDHYRLLQRNGFYEVLVPR
jgi:hypothetical protein